MEDDKVAKKIQNRRKSIQKAAETHARKTKERADDIKQAKAYYMAEKDGPVVQDLLKKASLFQSYHIKIAQDGVGARKTGFRLENGHEEVENYFLKPAERVSHLDKASGIQELIDYIQRQTASDVLQKQPEQPEQSATEEQVTDNTAEGTDANNSR